MVVSALLEEQLGLGIWKDSLARSLTPDFGDHPTAKLCDLGPISVT